MDRAEELQEGMSVCTEGHVAKMAWLRGAPLRDWVPAPAPAVLH